MRVIGCVTCNEQFVSKLSVRKDKLNDYWSARMNHCLLYNQPARCELHADVEKRKTSDELLMSIHCHVLHPDTRDSFIVYCTLPPYPIHHGPSHLSDLRLYHWSLSNPSATTSTAVPVRASSVDSAAESTGQYGYWDDGRWSPRHRKHRSGADAATPCGGEPNEGWNHRCRRTMCRSCDRRHHDNQLTKNYSCCRRHDHQALRGMLTAGFSGDVTGSSLSAGEPKGRAWRKPAEVVKQQWSYFDNVKRPNSTSRSFVMTNWSMHSIFFLQLSCRHETHVDPFNWKSCTSLLQK